MKHVLEYLRELEESVESDSQHNWPLASKVAWKLRRAVDKDLSEKNTPSFYFRERLSQIQHAVNMQTEDSILWDVTLTMRELYLQSALKDLHRVIENDEVDEALTMIRGRLDT
jgi:hypothetical protein